MKIFVTGGTGFIGSHFIRQALAAGHEVLALRRSEQSVPKIPLEKEPTWLDKSMVKVMSEDLLGCEAFVHLAAHSTNVPYDSLENCLKENVLAPLRLFREAIEAGIVRFIIAGTCFEYGSSGERYDFIPVTAPLEPTASYPASKAAASIAFHSLAVAEQLEMLQLRIFQVYGEGEPESRFWPTLRKKALGGEDMKMSAGEQVRDFINVVRVAAVFVESLERRDIKAGVPKIENVASGNPKSLAQFAGEQWRAFGATGKLLLGEVPMRKEEVMSYVPEVEV